MPSPAPPATAPANSAALEPVLRERFGLDAFRKGQVEILGSVLNGADALAILPISLPCPS